MNEETFWRYKIYGSYDAYLFWIQYSVHIVFIYYTDQVCKVHIGIHSCTDMFATNNIIQYK